MITSAPTTISSKVLPILRIETANVYAALLPLIKGARVLELACGTGYYSRLLLECPCG
jgi:protein-L-isoaspartate O-methyltransferase